MSEPTTHHFTITADDTRQRLDKYLSSQLPDLSRSFIQQLITDGHVQRNSATIANPSTKTKEGERYALTIPPVKELALEPVPMALDIAYEDEHFIILNKPAGLTVHPAPGTFEPTLVHGLLAHCGDQLSGIGGVARPGIVHRLDKDTSGLMVVAKTDLAHQHISAQLKDRSLSRTYLAWCWGGIPNPLSGMIDEPVGRNPQNRKKMAVVRSGGKEARTHYQVEEIFHLIHKGTQIPVATRVSCTLDTGRTHQIRVHLTHLGHGLVGDPVYGGSGAVRLGKLGIPSDDQPTILTQMEGQALHAHKIALYHPVTGQRIERQAEPPIHLKNINKTLKDLCK